MKRIILTALTCLTLFLSPAFSQTEEVVESQPAQQTSASSEKKPAETVKNHVVDLGIGIGLDYGGIVGVKLAYIFPYPHVSIFASGGWELFTMGWNFGATFHILPETSKYLFRPNVKVMYGVNGAVMIVGKESYNKVFLGFTPGVGVELMFGSTHSNGVDIDLNIPIHGPEFQNHINMIKADPEIAQFNDPWPVAFSFGYHHEF
jgi:hypothetical protein